MDFGPVLLPSRPKRPNELHTQVPQGFQKRKQEIAEFKSARVSISAIHGAGIPGFGVQQSP